MRIVTPITVLAALALLVLVAACGGGGSPPVPTQPPPTLVTPATAQAICGATHRVAGTVESPELVEISGIATSPRNAEYVLWAHNDSGDSARVFAITTSGRPIASFTLAGAEAIDWEAMTIGPGPEKGTSYLYVGDIGDNDAQRPEIVVYRLPEPQQSAVGTPFPDIVEYDTLRLRYPDGAHDAETLLVDPVDGDLLIVTKDIATRRSQVFRLPANAEAGEHSLEEVAQIDFTALRSSNVIPADAPPLPRGLPNVPTDGDVSPSGELVALRTYGTVWVWSRPDGAPLWDAFETPPCEAPSAIEEQGEAIAFDAAGTGYITVSEGRNPQINYFGTQ